MSFLDTVSPNIKVTEYLSNIPLTKSILRTDLVSDPSVPVDWAEYKTITIDPDKISDELIDFPLMINISNSSGYDNTDLSELFTLVEGDYTRIQIRANDDITPLYTEVEKWDVVNGSAILNTKIPIVSSTETTVIKIFYKTTDVTNEFIGMSGTIVAENVWDDNFSMVQHMNQDPSGTAPQIIDSTDSNHDGTSEGVMLTEDLVDGLVGKGLEFDGSDDRINFGNTNSSLGGDITISASINLNTINSEYQPILTKAAEGAMEYGFYIKGDEIHFQNYNGGWITFTTSNVNFTTNIFYNIAVVFNITENNIKMYNNGVEIYSDGIETGLAVNVYNCYTGNDTGDWFLSGIIDNLRFSTTARSSSYIAAENYTLRDDLVTYDTYVPAQPPG